MTLAQQAVNSALKETDTLKKVLKHSSSVQVRSDDELQTIQAISHAWFNNHRKPLAQATADSELTELDEIYRELMAASSRATSRSKYHQIIKRTKKLLQQFQTDQVLVLAADRSIPPNASSDDKPQFAAIVADSKMQNILGSRWQECVTCVNAGAPLAAIVMMGGMLESLLLARVNQLNDKSPVFKSAHAPKDHKTGAALKLNEWGLKNFLDVAHELKWISKTTKDVGEVVRDYRNYIHPQKEYSHGISISVEDSRTLWEIAKNVAHQVLKP